MAPIRRIAVAVALRRKTVGQFVRFGLVGGFNTVLDFSVYYMLTRSSSFWGEHLVLAAVASFTVGVISSFILNNFWTFRQSAAGWRSRIWKFFIVAVGGVSWNALLLFVFVNLGMFDLYAKAIATAAVLFWNFTLQKMWTFRE